MAPVAPPPRFRRLCIAGQSVAAFVDCWKSVDLNPIPFNQNLYWNTLPIKIKLIDLVLTEGTIKEQT